MHPSDGIPFAAFEQRLRSNRVVAFLAGFPVLWPPTAYREFHFAHHRHTHDPELEPEISLGGDTFAHWPGKIHEYLAFASGLLLLLMRVVMIPFFALGVPDLLWDRFTPYVRARYRKQIVWESRAFLTAYACLVGLAMTSLPAVGYLLVSLLIAHSILALHLASEHTGCETTGSIYARTRTVMTSRTVRFFMWNMPFHTEHHAFPNVPFHTLPKFHRVIQDRLVVTESGYASLHQNVVRQICSRPARQ